MRISCPYIEVYNLFPRVITPALDCSSVHSLPRRDGLFKTFPTFLSSKTSLMGVFERFQLQCILKFQNEGYFCWIHHQVIRVGFEAWRQDHCSKKQWKELVLPFEFLSSGIFYRKKGCLVKVSSRTGKQWIRVETAWPDSCQGQHGGCFLMSAPPGTLSGFWLLVVPYLLYAPYGIHFQMHWNTC